MKYEEHVKAAFERLDAARASDSVYTSSPSSFAAIRADIERLKTLIAEIDQINITTNTKGTP